MRGDVWSHKTSLALPLFIKVPVPSKKSERSKIKRNKILPLIFS